MNLEKVESATPSESKPPGVEWLVDQLKTLAPHLDSFGRAHCGNVGQSRGGRGGWPLDSEPVNTLLAYRHRLQHGLIPTKSELEQARTLVVGSLWEERGRRFEADSGLPLVVEVIISAVEEDGEFLGSAGEARTLLQNHLKKHPEKRRGAESLPRNPEQMGMALSRYGVILREHGVELSRPRRSDVKRLWAWRRLEPLSDTPDRCDGSRKDPSESPNGRSTKRPDGSDALDDRTARRMALYRGETNATDAD